MSNEQENLKEQDVPETPNPDESIESTNPPQDDEPEAPEPDLTEEKAKEDSGDLEPQEENKVSEVDYDYTLRFRVPFGQHKKGDTNKFSGKLSEKIYNYDTLEFKYLDLLSAGIVEVVSQVPLQK